MSSPVARPSASRAISPATGSGVVAVIPAFSISAPLPQPECTSDAHQPDRAIRVCLVKHLAYGAAERRAQVVVPIPTDHPAFRRRLVAQAANKLRRGAAAPQVDALQAGAQKIQVQVSIGKAGKRTATGQVEFLRRRTCLTDDLGVVARGHHKPISQQQRLRSGPFEVESDHTAVADQELTTGSPWSRSMQSRGVCMAILFGGIV